MLQIEEFDTVMLQIEEFDTGMLQIGEFDTALVIGRGIGWGLLMDL